MKVSRTALGHRLGAATVMAVAALLVVTGCTVTPNDSDATGTPAEDTVVSIANTGELCSTNRRSQACQLLVNGQVAYFTTAQFQYISDDAEIVYDESFGTIEMLSEDPLTIKYTVNEGVVWSDGTQIGAADMMLEILVWTRWFDDLTADESAGTGYFNHTQSPAGMRLADFPEVGDDGRSMTITYERPYADWALIEVMNVPAHVVAEKAGLDPDPEAFIDFLRSVPRGDRENPVETNEQLMAVADFWNTGFQTQSLPSDPALYLASGPYVIESWDTGQSVTLVRNELYTGDRAGQFERVVVRFIADSTAQVQALANGEVDVIQPQSSADTLSGLEAIPTATVLTGTAGSRDYMQLNHANEAFSDPDVREAFLLTIPREQLMDAIVRPLDAEAPTLSSFLTVPGQPGYEEIVATNGSDAYSEVDIERAAQLLDGRTPTVRLAYNRDNPNRLDAFLAIQSSAEQAGFVVEDVGLPASDWIGVLPQGERWDAFIWGAASAGVGVFSLPQYFQSTSPSAFGGWTNPDADALIDEILTTVDLEDQRAIVAQVDTLAWQDGWGMPLFVNVGIQAYSDRVTGVEYYPWSMGPIWNYWEWQPAG